MRPCMQAVHTTAGVGALASGVPSMGTTDQLVHRSQKNRPPPLPAMRQAVDTVEVGLDKTLESSGLDSHQKSQPPPLRPPPLRAAPVRSRQPSGRAWAGDQLRLRTTAASEGCAVVAAPVGVVQQPVDTVEVELDETLELDAHQSSIGKSSHKQDLRKVLTLWSENPANFHQAACVFLLGGKEGKRSSKFPRPENISRMTNTEMKLAWEAANSSISKNERLVCHFTSMESASVILGVDSPGFRASVVGQGGGGFFVCSVGPHELEWEQYQSGNFRQRTGRELWGEKWEHLLEGGKDADKVEMVFFIKIPAPFYEQGRSIPGRKLARIITPEVLYEYDGYHWLQKEKIVKSYVLVRDAPELKIVGEGPPPESSSQLKWSFAGLSALMVIFQALAMLAIIFNTKIPSCVTNLQCERVGWYCTAIGDNSGRCEPCAYAGDPDHLNELNAEGFCANETQFSADYCDRSIADGEKTCAHPACRACPDQDAPGWGLSYRKAISTGNGNVGLEVMAWKGKWATHAGNSTWGITSEHTFVRDNVQAMKLSDFAMLFIVATVVSFSLAAEIRDIKLCELTIHDRGGGCPWLPLRNMEKMLLAAVFTVALVLWANMTLVGLRIGPYVLRIGLFAFHCLIVTPVVVALIDVRAGNSPWRIFLLVLNALRRCAVVPLLASGVPILVLFDAANAKDMALNTVGALFLLSVDNEAFAFALPDHIRTHVEEYGRAEVGKKEARVLNAVKTWTWIPQCVAMIFPVLAVKYIHDPATGWVQLPDTMALFVPVFAVLGGISAEALTTDVEETEYSLSVADRTVVAALEMSIVVCLGLFQVRKGSGEELPFVVVGCVCALAFLVLLWRLDGNDGGGRLGTFCVGIAKFSVGFGAVLAALAFLES